MRSAWAVVAVTGCLAAQCAHAAPASNWVSIGDGSKGLQYLDTASIQRGPDEVAFDLLYGSWVQTYATRPVEFVRGEVRHLRISCGWRTSRLAPDTVEVYGEDAAFGGAAHRTVRSGEASETFLFEDAFMNGLADRLCSPAGLPPQQGVATVEEILEAHKSRPAPRMSGPVAPIAAPDPVRPDWMQGERPHHFVAVRLEDEYGRRLFLDRANFNRQGDHVEGFALAFLGPEAQRGYRFGLTVMLRHMRYDCAARAATVLMQSGWYQSGDLDGGSEAGSVGRSAGVSPVVASEIESVCHNQGFGGASFASVEDAWEYVHSQWRPRSVPWDVACLWAATPADRRDQPINWPTEGHPFRLSLISKDLRPQMQACSRSANPNWNIAQSLLSSYVLLKASEAALQKSTQLSPEKLEAVWRELPWLDRHRARIKLMYAESQFRQDLVERMSRRLQVTRGEARQQLVYFMLAEAQLDYD